MWWQTVLGVVGVIMAVMVVVGVSAWVLGPSKRRRPIMYDRAMMDLLMRNKDLHNLYYHRYPSNLEEVAHNLDLPYSRRVLARGGEEDDRKAKKEFFLNQGPRTFYFLDERAVNELYPQIFKEIEPVEMQTEEHEAKEGGIRARLHFIEPKFGKKSGLSVRRTYVKEQNLGAVFNQVEKFLLENEQVYLGLEDFAEREPFVDEFRTMCAQMDERFHFKVPQQLQEQYITQQREALAMKKVKQLKETHDYLLVRGQFSVGSTDNQWLLVYLHPLNTNLSSTDKRVTFSVAFPKERTTPAGGATLSSTATVNLTLFGKVICWEEDNWVLKINPLAIY
jgi:hypothetical protein